MRANSAQAIAPEQPAVDQRRIREIPRVWMGRIETAEGGEELPRFYLQAEGQTGRLQERFFEFNLRLVIVIQLQDDVGEAFEIGIDRAIERDLGIARVKAALLRIVIANFDVIDIACGGAGEGKLTIEGDVHVGLGAAATTDDRNRLGQRGAACGRVGDTRDRGIGSGKARAIRIHSRRIVRSDHGAVVSGKKRRRNFCGRRFR